MTIDEAIAREIKKAENSRNNIVPKENYHNMPWIDKSNEASMRSAEEHEQLAEWLEDYKRIKMLIPIEQALKAEYNKAIDDFIKAVDKHCGYYAGECKSLTRDDLLKIAKELKDNG